MHLLFNLQILYDTSKKNQEETNGVGFSLKVTSEIMDSLLKSLTDGEECHIQMESVGDGGSGVLSPSRC